MAFNRKRFLESLIGVSDPGIPNTPVSMDFAQYFASNPWGGLNLQTDSSVIAEKAKQEGEREEGALAKVFGHLMSAGTGVQNIALDVTEAIKGEDSLAQTGKDIGKDVLGFMAHVNQPLAEVSAVPGVKLPFGDLGTDKLTEFIENENVEHHGDNQHISGRRLLEEWGADPKNKTKNAISGLVLDIVSDPATYLGVGLPGRAKQIHQLATKGVDDTLERAAATDNAINTSVAAPQAPVVPLVSNEVASLESELAKFEARAQEIYSEAAKIDPVDALNNPAVKALDKKIALIKQKLEYARTNSSTKPIVPPVASIPKVPVLPPEIKLPPVKTGFVKPEVDLLQYLDDPVRGIAPTQFTEPSRNVIKQAYVQPTGPFHGTSNPIKKLVDSFNPTARDQNLLGPGFYSTHDYRLGESYRQKGIKAGQALDDTKIYSVKWKGKNPPKLLDLEGPPTPELVEYARKLLAESQRNMGSATANAPDSYRVYLGAEDQLEDILRSIDGTNTAPLRQPVTGYDVAKAITDAIRGPAPDSVVAAKFKEYADHLKKAGYDGLRHIGGRIMGSQEHTVDIFFDTSKLGLKEAPLQPVTKGLEAQRSLLSPIPFSHLGANELTRKIAQTNAAGELNPAAKRAASAIRAGEIKNYEKLRPVSVEGLPVPRSNKRYAAEYDHGRSATDNIMDDFSEPRPLTRQEQVNIAEEWFAEAGLAGEKGIAAIRQDVTRYKHFAKGMEDDLLDRGFTFPEGRLSQWLNKKDVTKTDQIIDFVKGKPLKERPSIVEDTAPVTMRFGDKFLNAKGITPESVANAVKEVGRLVSEGAAPIKNIEPVTGDLKAVAIQAAEDHIQGLKDAGKLRNLNPVNQANLYNRMYNHLMKRYSGDIKMGAVQKRTVALRMTRAAEDYLIATHKLKPMYWDGTGLRLTSVLAELDPKLMTGPHMTKIMDAWRTQDLSKITDPVAKAAFETAMAKRHIQMGAVAKGVLEGFRKTDEIMKESVSFQKYLAWKRGDAIPKVNAQMQVAGATPAEARAAERIAGNAVDAKNIPFAEPMGVIDNVGIGAVKTALETGKPLAAEAINGGIIRSVGETASTIGRDLRGHKVWDAIMLRLFTWYGKGDMAGTALERGQAIESIAKKRSAYFNERAKKYTLVEQQAAFRYAQDIDLLKNTNPPAHIRQFAEEIRDHFENILGSKSTFATLQNSAFSDMAGSLAVRSAFTMDDLNRHLKAVGSHFQFSGSSKLKGGKDYGEGHWMRSWERADPTVFKQDPVSFLYDLDLAAFRLATEYSVIDDFAMRFGKRGLHIDETVHTKGLVHHRVPDDVKFEGQVADDFTELMKQMEKGQWRPDSDFGKMYVKALRMWKTGMTIYSPSHHSRNLIGDTWLMWMAGHNDPLVFADSRKILSSQRARYAEALKADSMDEVNKLLGASKPLREEASWARATGSDVIIKRGNITSDEIYGEAMQRGLLLDASRAEDILDGNNPMFGNIPGKKPSALKKYANAPLGGKAHKSATFVAEYREHFVRTAHFTAAVRKGITPKMATQLKGAKTVAERRKILEPVYEKAAAEVRKWHPDGRDMTQFEQKWMRNIIPFYSWQRKAIPLIIESMVTRPSKITMYPRGMYAVQGAFGIESPGPSDPFPEDQLFPDWMRFGGIGPIGDPQSDNPISSFLGKLGRGVETIQGETGYTVINPGNPFNDTIAQFGQSGSGPIESARKGVGGMLTPAFNIPKELISDKKFTGAPISKDEGGEGYPAWAAEQVPILTILQRILEPGEEHAEGVATGPNSEALYNWLSGLGIKGSGQYYKSAEFDAKDAAKKQREELLKRLGVE